MGLQNYISKRHLAGSGEPGGKAKSKRKKGLNFVVQRHAASHLHYDFRLEMEGVLKSWAIPKGPSMDPSVKRLAIQVEDHPLDYQYFEGTIPPGNYGAGEVTIWDHGTYEPVEIDASEDKEKNLMRGLEKGDLKFILHGKKLQGAFILVKTKKDNQWLLIKKKDSHASNEEIGEEARSQEDDLLKSNLSPMPHHIKPMLATLVEKPFDEENWIFEVKWDGFRAISEIVPPNVRCYSRNDESFADRFPAIIEELKEIKEEMILDGEIVVLDKKGISHFQLLQNYMRKPEGALRYLVFDLLYYKGHDLRQYPLRHRRALLKSIFSKAHFKHLIYSDEVTEKGIAFFKKATQMGLEGIIAKDLNSTYFSRRMKTWLKIKSRNQQEFVIGGYTEPKGSRKYIGALIVGVYKNKKLAYVGNVGGGFDQKTLKEVYDKLQPLKVETCPFHPLLKDFASHWVKPVLLCEVSFQEWTQEGQLRQPVFMGLRTDKKASQVVKEKPEETQPTYQSNSSHRDLISHPEKVFWPDEGYTKQDLITYYRKVSKYILPHLKDRPEILHRFPNGIEESGFYQKEAPSDLPKEIQKVQIKHTERTISYLLIQDLKSLIYTVNLGCIEMHPFLSRYQSIDKPDYLVIDLDPEKVDFKYVVECALSLHELLEKAEIPNYCKTSGASGLHVFIPLKAQYTFDQIHDFSELLAVLTHRLMPKKTAIVRSPSKRQGMVYLDYLQNRLGQSIVAPYSVRPLKHAPVSTPLHWEEVNEKLNPQDFTIKTILKRIERFGDLFKPVLGKGINLKKCLNNLTRS